MPGLSAALFPNVQYAKGGQGAPIHLEGERRLWLWYPPAGKENEI
jgi:hypothetical protein